ncbi:hypothetical protein GM3708_3350 [Geminocystis sp. NIES-3708]|nr:hypothetical protein GM3708_3350 [Geminocystis sp. NIES-3708]
MRSRIAFKLDIILIDNGKDRIENVTQIRWAMPTKKSKSNQLN